MKYKLRAFSVHSCLLSRECWKYRTKYDRKTNEFTTGGTPPWRLHFNTPWWHFAFAFAPKSRFAWVDRSRWLSYGRWTKEDRKIWLKKR